MSVARAGAWFLGGRLSIATNVYFRSPNGDYNKFLQQAKGVATDLGVDIPPLPPKPTVSTDGLVRYLGYFNQGDGAKIKAQLARAWGPEHATLYQIAARLFQLSLLYDLDPKLGDKVARAITADSESVGLPEALWRPAIDAVTKRASADEVKKKAIQTYFDVQQFLIKGAGG